MCYRPTLIRLKGSGEWYRVPCGKCYECINLKAHRNSLLLNQESSRHRYVEFVHLTYNMKYVPVARFFYDTVVYHDGLKIQKVNHVVLKNISSRFDDVYADSHQVVSDGYFDNEQLQQIIDTFKENKYVHFPENTLPYISSVDAQRFIKRLRNWISYCFCKNKQETVPSIRYYICAEYGPKTFRPHFHALIFHDSFALHRKMGYLLSKAWKYGRFDYGLARGGAAPYCASYVAGNTCLPPVHSLRHIRPKYWHSRNLGQAETFIISKGLQALDYETSNSFTVVVFNKLKSVPASFQIQNNLFPRCVGYGRSSHALRLNRYTFLSKARRFFPTGRLTDLAKWIAHECDICNKFFAPLIDVLPDGYASTEQSIYSILCTSSRFFRLCRLFDTTSEVICRKIEQYYDTLDRVLLRRFYSDSVHPVNFFSYGNITEETSSDLLESRFGLTLQDCFSKISGWFDPNINPTIASAYAKSQKIFYDRFKHREQADALGLYSYDNNKDKLMSQLSI